MNSTINTSNLVTRYQWSENVIRLPNVLTWHFSCLRHIQLTGHQTSPAASPGSSWHPQKFLKGRQTCMNQLTITTWLHGSFSLYFKFKKLPLNGVTRMHHRHYHSNYCQGRMIKGVIKNLLFLWVKGSKTVKKLERCTLGSCEPGIGIIQVFGTKFLCEETQDPKRVGLLEWNRL